MSFRERKAARVLTLQMLGWGLIDRDDAGKQLARLDEMSFIVEGVL